MRDFFWKRREILSSSLLCHSSSYAYYHHHHHCDPLWTERHRLYSFPLFSFTKWWWWWIDEWLWITFFFLFGSQIISILIFLFDSCYISSIIIIESFENALLFLHFEKIQSFVVVTKFKWYQLNDDDDDHHQRQNVIT